MHRALIRFFSLGLIAVGSCRAGELVGVMEQLRIKLQEDHPFVATAPVESPHDLVDNDLLVLNPVVVRAPAFLIEDLTAEARRAAEAEKAKQFSPLRGGLLYSKGKLDLGIWPKLVPTDDTPMKKGEVMLRVDLLRMKWSRVDEGKVRLG